MTKHIIIVDDHELMLKGITTLVNELPQYTVTHALSNGKELVTLLGSKKNIPDVLLLDINMPVMNGFETMQWLNEHQYTIPVIALTINTDDESILKMLRHGVKGYLLKDTAVQEISLALDTVLNNGFYFTEVVNKTLLNQHTTPNKPNPHPILKDRELEFLELAATDCTYSKIAEIMNLSPKTIDHYREILFEKFKVKSRVALVVYALKENYITL